MKRNGSTSLRPTAGPSVGSAEPIARLRAAEERAEELIQRARRRAREIVQAAQDEAQEHRRDAQEQARTAARRGCERVLDQAEAQIRAIDRETETKIIELRSQAQLHVREALSLVVGAVQK